tara:strand:- start:190 stop:486 length:297 start_codon:yes stop_codon:yes gene_type:complete
MLFVGFSLLFSVSSNSASLNDGGYVGCVSEDYLDQFISAAVKNDSNAMDYLLKNYRCVPLSSKFEISILDSGFSTVQIRVYAGGDAVELWTVREAVNR